MYKEFKQTEEEEDDEESDDSEHDYYKKMDPRDLYIKQRAYEMYIEQADIVWQQFTSGNKDFKKDPEKPEK